MHARGVIVVLLVIGFIATVLVSAPPARAVTWTQTTASDFLAGQRANLDVRPSGDLVLNLTSAAWVREGVVLDLGAGSAPDSVLARNPSVLKDGGVYKMWYSGQDASPRNRILYATSSDGLSWTRQGVVLDVLQPPWNFDSVVGPSVRKEGSTYKMWFSGGFWTSPLTGSLYYAESADGVAWNIIGMALGQGPAGSWDDQIVAYAHVARDAAGRYWMYYTGWDGSPGGLPLRMGVATSATGQTFSRVGVDPLLPLGPTGSWDDTALSSPFVVPGNPWQMWYSGTHASTAQIGLATAVGPYNWSRSPGNPEFVPGPPGAWDDAAVSSCYVLYDGADTFLYYSGGDGANTRIGRARLSSAYVASGWFESQVLDTGFLGTRWTTLSANATVNLVSQVFLRTRTGDTPVPDASWSPWSPQAGPGVSGITSPRGRYLQVRVELATASSLYTPILNDFTVSYELNSAAGPTPVSPVGGSWVAPSNLRMTWAFSDPEGDLQGGYHVQISDRTDFATVTTESGDVLSSSASWQSPMVPDGDWYWRVRTLDAFDAWGPYSPVAFFRVDSYPPSTTIGFTLTPGNVGGTPQLDSSNRIVLSGTDAGSGVAQVLYTLNGGPSSSYSGPFLPAVHGVATLQYWSVDAVGNAETPNAIDLLIDNPPLALPSSPANGAWTNDSSPTVGWTYLDPDADPPSAYEVQLTDDPAFTRVSYSSGIVATPGTTHAFPGVADGTYLWRVRAADVYGTWSAFSGARSLSVDTRPPSVSHSFDATLGVIAGRVWVPSGTRVTLTATDSGSGIAAIHYSIDGASAVYSSPVTLSTHGAHTLDYWSVDVAGNRGPTVTVQVLIDGQPTVTNAGPADQAWINTGPTVQWSPVDPDGDGLSAFEAQVSADSSFSSLVASSGVVDSPGASAWNTPRLADGAFYWRVRVQDEFGVWSSWSSPTRFGVDTTPPAAIARHGGSAVPTGQYTLLVGDALSIEATDAGSGVARIEISLDGGPWTVYSAPITFEAPGRHLLAFRGVDNAGNVEEPGLLAIDVVFPFNWTPVVALVLAVVLAVLGALVARRSRGKPVSRPLAWALVAAPATVVEVLVAVYSALTGELAMPPWIGAGLVVVAGIAAGGFVSIAIGTKVLGARGGLEA